MFMYGKQQFHVTVNPYQTEKKQQKLLTKQISVDIFAGMKASHAELLTYEAT